MAKDPSNEDGRRDGRDTMFDEMRASHNDLVSVQNSILFERWLALMDGQDNADSMAAVSSS